MLNFFDIQFVETDAYSFCVFLAIFLTYGQFIEIGVNALRVLIMPKMVANR